MATPVSNAVGVTDNPLIDGLVQGGAWQFSSTPAVLTYSFSLNDTPVGGAWTYPLIDSSKRAFSEWSKVANIVFTEAGSGTVFP